MRAAARAAYADLIPFIRQLVAEGWSQRDIAARLNAEGRATRRGGKWYQAHVQRALAKYGPPDDDARI